MLVLGERDVRTALDPQACLDVNLRALVALADKTGVVPTRLALPYPGHPHLRVTAAAQDWTLVKPAAYYGGRTAAADQDGGGDQDDNGRGVVMGLKVVSVRADNPGRGLPLVPATVLLVDAASGVVSATVAGTHLTAMRTSAGPALAVRAFRPDAQRLVIFGAGAQAEGHVQLMEVALRRRIPYIAIVNRTLGRAQALQTKLQDGRAVASSSSGVAAAAPSLIEAVALDDTAAVRRVLAEADVVAATTNSASPLFDGAAVTLRRGCLITGIGSYTPDMQEIPRSVVDRSVVVVDTPEAMQVGDLKHLGGEDAFFRPGGAGTHPVFLAGDALTDPSKVLRRSASNSDGMDYIFYKAVGTAIQDVLTAQEVVSRANELGIGQNVDMS